MRLDGASLRTIGKAAGLSAQGVRQILNRAGHK
jgi:DNA-directed RNA polymerase sigma subunit (sigma70/sigma32)